MSYICELRNECDEYNADVLPLEGVLTSILINVWPKLIGSLSAYVKDYS